MNLKKQEKQVKEEQDTYTRLWLKGKNAKERNKRQETISSTVLEHSWFEFVKWMVVGEIWAKKMK